MKTVQAMLAEAEADSANESVRTKPRACLDELTCCFSTFASQLRLQHRERFQGALAVPRGRISRRPDLSSVTAPADRNWYSHRDGPTISGEMWVGHYAALRDSDLTARRSASRSVIPSMRIDVGAYLFGMAGQPFHRLREGGNA